MFGGPRRRCWNAATDSRSVGWRNTAAAAWPPGAVSIAASIASEAAPASAMPSRPSANGVLPARSAADCLGQATPTAGPQQLGEKNEAQHEESLEERGAANSTNPHARTGRRTGAAAHRPHSTAPADRDPAEAIVGQERPSPQDCSCSAPFQRQTRRGLAAGSGSGASRSRTAAWWRGRGA